MCDKLGVVTLALSRAQVGFEYWSETFLLFLNAFRRYGKSPQYIPGDELQRPGCKEYFYLAPVAEQGAVLVQLW